MNTQDLTQIQADPDKIISTVQLLFIFCVLSIGPALVVMVTSFTRIVIVLSFLKRALSTQEIPPTSVVVALSLVLTFMIMSPTFEKIKNDAIDPFSAKKISQKDAFDRSMGHLRQFMFNHTRSKDIKLFLSLKNINKPEILQNDVTNDSLISAFIISELRRAFIMGFAIFLPFMIIDLIVASTLVSVGMLVVPPLLISIPFKILVFILVDGWHLVIGSLVKSFSG